MAITPTQIKNNRTETREKALQNAEAELDAFLSQNYSDKKFELDITDYMRKHLSLETELIYRYEKANWKIHKVQFGPLYPSTFSITSKNV